MENIDNYIESVVVAEPVVIDYDSLKKMVEASLEDYRDIVVTEETYQLAKKKQREMAGMRNKLDEARKEVKRRFTEPLEIFEAQMKELQAMVRKVEDPIKDEIEKYDEARKDAKRQIAEIIIRDTAKRYELTQKYTEQIELRKKYLNLGSKESEVRADVEAQCMTLKVAQDNEEQTKEIILGIIENENKTLTAKLNPESYISLMDRISQAEIIKRVQTTAAEIREAEAKAAEPKVEEKPETHIPVDPPITDIPERPSEPQESDETLFQVTFIVIGNKTQQERLGAFLRENEYNYTVPDQHEIEQDVIF